MQFQYGVDLITFYHPEFWGATDRADFENRANSDPRRFWHRITESAAAAGITGVEITFPPGDWETALQTYDSASGFATALRGSGISLISGFFSALETYEHLDDPDIQSRVLDEARKYSAFLSEAGASILVAGMPMRRRGTPEQPSFVDLDYAKRVADLINQVGATSLSRGVRVALHTEVGSVFCLRRDIDLFMSLTDPAYVDLCPDTAHIFLGGVSPVEILRDHYERVTIAHWKDAVGRWPNTDLANEDRFTLEADYFRRVGTGSVDWAGWVRGLENAQFDGWAVLELDAAPNPVEDMTAARKFAEDLVGTG